MPAAAVFGEVDPTNRLEFQNGGKRGQSDQWSPSGCASGCPIALTARESQRRTARAVHNNVPARRAGVSIEFVGISATPSRMREVLVAPAAQHGSYGIADKRDFFSVSLGSLIFWIVSPHNQ